MCQQQNKLPPLCDLVSYAHSPLIRVQQYSSSLLAGDCSRLVLIWGRAHSSFEEWCECRPGEIALLRRLVGSMSGLFWQRFICNLMCSPWIFAGLLDNRRRDMDTLKVYLCNLTAEQLDNWFGKFFKDMLDGAVASDVDRALSSTSAESAYRKLLQGLYLWSWEILLTNAQREFQHGRNRTACTESTCWHNFVATTRNHEQKRRVLWQDQAFNVAFNQTSDAACGQRTKRTFATCDPAATAHRGIGSGREMQICTRWFRAKKFGSGKMLATKYDLLARPLLTQRKIERRRS